MDSLFSHGRSDSTAAFEQTEYPPSITVEVLVPRGIADAFSGFTDGIHLWWPSEDTYFGEDTHVEFTDGQLLEEDPEGEVEVWATILTPPGTESGDELVLELAWHHRTTPHHTSRVALSFAPDQAGTRVVVTHQGWAAGPEGAAQVEDAPDWSAALTSYQRFMGGAS